MTIRFGEFVFDSETRQLSRGEDAIHISPKAFELLQILIEERPRAVTKRRLIDRLWPDVIVEEANVRNLIAEIRTAIGDDDSGSPVIRTLPRFGYAFAGVAERTARPTTARLVHALHAFVLSNDKNVVGRDADCEIVLDAAGVSRHHAEIRMTPQRITIKDLGSKNGTWVNEQRIDAVTEISDGDKIRIGSLTLTLRTAGRSDITQTIDG